MRSGSAAAHGQRNGSCQPPPGGKDGGKLPKFSGATQLEPYLAQFRLVEWHNGWVAGEARGTVPRGPTGPPGPDPGVGEAFRAGADCEPQPGAANQPPPPGGGMIGGLRSGHSVVRSAWLPRLPCCG